ncbi:Leukocyte surface antigen CD47 [Pteropus alecto]|uniref:Leukocyte surface antigen CD47 n=1 Tax=Pteropus alecto TaxID=9402 RepID=L5L524_PTEAL|nr:Leukocyte surface antigen CD47 [Pteropus alecto]
MDRSDAVPGNYSCEVTELSREGEIIVELKHRVVLWFSPNENILIIIFPMLAILLFWGQFGVVTLKYSTVTKEKTILLFVAGLVLTIVMIVGAILFIPGEYSTKKASGLGLIVVPTVILILLQYSVFMIAPAIGMSSFSIAILILQVLGFVLAVVGLRLCISASNQRTIQPPRPSLSKNLDIVSVEVCDESPPVLLSTKALFLSFILLLVTKEESLSVQVLRLLLIGEAVFVQLLIKLVLLPPGHSILIVFLLLYLFPLPRRASSLPGTALAHPGNAARYPAAFHPGFPGGSPEEFDLNLINLHQNERSGYFERRQVAKIKIRIYCGYARMRTESRATNLEF